MQIILRKNATDRYMIDVLTEDDGRLGLWAVVHEDFVWDEPTLKDLVKTGNEVRCELTLAENE